MVLLGNVEIEVVLWRWGFSAVGLVVGVKPVDEEA